MSNTDVGFCKICKKPIAENDDFCRCSDEGLYYYIGGDIKILGHMFVCSLCENDSYTLSSHLNHDDFHAYTYCCSTPDCDGVILMQNEKSEVAKMMYGYYDEEN